MILFMNFRPENRFKIRQAFAMAAAGLCMATSMATLPTYLGLAIFPVTLTLYTAFYFRERYEYTKPSKHLIIPEPTSPVARMVEDVAGKAGITPPRIAFSLNDPSNSMSRPGVLLLDWRDFHPQAECQPEEIEAVVAHELAHKKNRDNLKSFFMIQTIIACTLGLIIPIANTISSGKPLPLGQTILNMSLAFSSLLLTSYLARQYEYEADRISVHVMGSAKPLRDYLAHSIDVHNTFFNGPAAIPLSALCRKKGWASGKTLTKINRIYDSVAGPAVRAWRKLNSDHPMHEGRFKSLEQEEKLIRVSTQALPS